MTNFSESLQKEIARFHERVMADPNIYDPEGVRHHEFVDGAHGRKINYDGMEEGTEFYIDGVSLYAKAALEIYADGLPDAVVGVAKGGNRLAESVGHLLGHGVVSIVTEKVNPQTVRLNKVAADIIKSTGAIKFAVAIEDVGSTGSTAATAIKDLWANGVERAEVLHLHQRKLTLPKLDALGVIYNSVITEDLPMFTSEECASNPEGYCHRRIKLIPHA